MMLRCILCDSGVLYC